MSAAQELDVLVVGAGPSGLATASEILRHGGTCRVIEQLAEPVVYSKAAVVHARTMEVYDAMGVRDAMLEHARPLQGLNLFAGGRRVSHMNFQGAIDSPYPHVYGISQHDTEQVLAAHLARLGGRIERSVRLTGFTQDDAGVCATLCLPDGKEEQVRARFLVGCDGAHSAVRKTLGIPFHGGAYEELLIQADVRVELQVGVDEDELVLFLDEHGPAAFFPLFRDGRYRLILFDMKDPPPAGKDKAPEPTMEDFRRGLAARGIAAQISDPAWMVGFRIHHRHVERLRERRAFLIGDAAHIHSPLGGQGMNTGLQDAFNLAWKLMLVARGRARPELLDSFEAERLPVIRTLLSNTDRATRGLETVVKLRHPIAQALRNQVIGVISGLGAVQSRAAQTLSMVGIGYDDSPICAQDRPTLWQARVLDSKDSEGPSILDWAAFGDGPVPGSRAPDATIQGGTGAGPLRVHELLRTGRHVALLFDGAAATPEGYKSLTTLAQQLRVRYADLVDSYLVVPMAAAPEAARWDGPTLLDATGELHKRYGARSECVYVLRPDGHVGYRAQPAAVDKLQAWLDRFLIPAGEK